MEETQEKKDGIIVINGVELKFDALDADDLECFEKENDIVQEKLRNSEEYKEAKGPDKFRIQCKIVEDFFDNMWGKGTAVSIFGEGNVNVGKHIEAYSKIVDEISEAPRRMAQLTGMNIGQPALANRAMRRAAQHQKAPQPGKQTHYDSYKDRLEKAKPVAVITPTEETEDAEEEDVEEKNVLLEILGERGLTYEQFEKAMQIAVNMKDTG